MNHPVKQSLDVIAYGNMAATLMGWLPPVAAGLTVLWLAIQILEKITGRDFVEMVRCFLDRLRP